MRLQCCGLHKHASFLRRMSTLINEHKEDTWKNHHISNQYNMKRVSEFKSHGQTKKGTLYTMVLPFAHSGLKEISVIIWDTVPRAQIGPHIDRLSRLASACSAIDIWSME